tara:strand:- start:3265 stop:7797 length:4533 start_codon:yes stop_codon:yes gene_type:complete
MSALQDLCELTASTEDESDWYGGWTPWGEEVSEEAREDLAEEACGFQDKLNACWSEASEVGFNSCMRMRNNIDLIGHALELTKGRIRNENTGEWYLSSMYGSTDPDGVADTTNGFVSAWVTGSQGADRPSDIRTPSQHFDRGDLSDDKRYYGVTGESDTLAGEHGFFTDYESDGSTVQGLKDDANWALTILVYMLRYMNTIDYLEREYLANFAENPDIDKTEKMMGMVNTDGEQMMSDFTSPSAANRHELEWVIASGIRPLTREQLRDIDTVTQTLGSGTHFDAAVASAKAVQHLEPLFDLDGYNNFGSTDLDQDDQLMNIGTPDGRWEGGRWGSDSGEKRALYTVAALHRDEWVRSMPWGITIGEPGVTVSSSGIFSWTQGFGIASISARLLALATRFQDQEMNAEFLVFRTLGNDISAACDEISNDIHILGTLTDLKDDADEHGSVGESWNCGIRSEIDGFKDFLKEISDEADDWLDDDELLAAVDDIEIAVDEDYVNAADLNAIDYAQNPKKVFYKEQCFLLSFLDYFVEEKRRADSRGVRSEERQRMNIAIEAAFSAEGISADAASARRIARSMEEYDLSFEDASARMGGINSIFGDRDMDPNAVSIARGVYQREEASIATNVALTRGNKRLPYLPGTDQYVGNASVLCDGDPYAFVNRLIMHPAQKSFIDVPHAILSQLQPKIRLYKVIYDDQRDTESEIEFKFNSFFAGGEMSHFIDRGVRAPGVGVKSFDFTYDGSNPFSAKKSIKAKLVLFANTFDELLACRGACGSSSRLGTQSDVDSGMASEIGDAVYDPFGGMGDPAASYKYTDLAMKTFGASELADRDDEGCDRMPWQTEISRENQELAKLNFRLKATVGITVPNNPTFGVNGTTRELTDLGSGLNTNNVTLNLTPTIHDFSFDEMGRVTFTINYLAFVDDFYDSQAFNIFANAGITLRRMQREANYEAAEAACEAEDMDAVREQNAKFANDEFRQALQGLVSGLITRDRVRYISISNEDIIGFTSYGPYYSDQQSESGFDINDLEIMEGEDWNESLQDQVDDALDTMQERSDPDREERAHEPTDEQAIAAALMVESPTKQNLSFFYISDLIDICLENIEKELTELPDQLDPNFATDTDPDRSGWSGAGSMSTGLDSCMKARKAAEIRKYDRAFKKLRIVLGPVEIVPVRDTLDTQFVNFGDIPISMKYFVEWMTMKFFSKSEYVYTLSKFVMDLMNNLVDQFLNSDKCFGYPTRQNITMNQAVLTGNSEEIPLGDPDYVMDSLTFQALQQGSRRCDLADPDAPRPMLRTAGYDATSPRDDIPIQKEVNYFVFFAGSVIPTDAMQGNKVRDEELGIYHYMIGRDRGLVYDISLTKASTPGLAEVRFEQDGYDGLKQLRVIYDAKITTFANVNTFPGTYLFIEPYGFSPSAQNEIDLTQFGLGGYYMIISSKHTFKPGTAKTVIDAKWVNQIEAEGRSEGMERSSAEAKSRTACAASTAGNEFNPFERDDPPEEEEDTGIFGWNTGIGL